MIIYDTLVNILGSVIYGGIPAVTSFEYLSLALLCTTLSFITVLVPFFVAWYILRLIFRIFSWGT